MLRRPSGAILLFTVLILGGVSIGALAIASRSSIGGLVDATEQLNAAHARAKLFGCLDEALIQIQKANDFAPSTLSIGYTSCTLTVQTPQSGQRRIILSLTENGLTRSLQADVQLSPFAVLTVSEQ